jgi:oxygen-independent coproporphyrinogen III oxidase
LWEFSLAETIATGVPHVSVYMLEVDEGSRLGRELMAGGARYHAHFVPEEDAMADFYLAACDNLETAGVAQYEISNFARPGFDSQHNLKYWTRQPYLGFGVDAHSMLVSDKPQADVVRFSTADTLEQYVAGAPSQSTVVSPRAGLEESFFLGLRLTRGVSLPEVSAKFGEEALRSFRDIIAGCIDGGLMERDSEFIRLTSRGRLLSNEVFQRFILADEVAH